MPPNIRYSAAEALAQSLAAKFLENGNYGALGMPFSPTAIQHFAPATASEDVEAYFAADFGFSGLAVHSVGFTAGAEMEKVVIYVTKGSRKALKGLPNEVDGVQVEAKLMGRLKAGPSATMSLSGLSNFYERNGRIACGSSCAPSNEQYSGTIGGLVSDGSRIFALSNNHVFAACNHTPVGMPILAPSTADARPNRRAPTEVCRHDRIVELRSGDPPLVQLMRLDAAIGEVTNPQAVSSWQGDNANGYDTPTAVKSPRSGLRVKKVGRTTGLTTGIIEALVSTPWALPYRSNKFTATVWFVDTWTVSSDGTEPFALPGDSGSLVVTEDESASVGLLFAGNNRGEYGIIMPIEDVIAAFGIANLVAGHGV
jgi:hypothetical protein